MYKYKKIIMYLGFSFLFGVLGAVSCDALTLQQAILAAYQNNPSIKASAADLKSSKEKIAQAYGAFLPNINLKGETSVTKSGASGVLPDQTMKQTNYGVNLSENLFQSGGGVAAINAAKATYKAAEYKYDADEQTMVKNVVHAYMSVLQNMSILKLKKENVKVSEQQLRSVQNQFRVGDATRTDVAQSLSNLSEARAALIAANGDYQDSYASFLALVGVAPDHLVDPHFSFPFFNSLDDSLRQAMRNNPAVLTASYNYNAAKSSLSIDKSKLLPSLNLSAGVTRAYNGHGMKKWQTVGNVGLSLTIPIFQNGVQWSMVRASEQGVIKAEETLRSTRRTVISDTTKAWEDYKTAVARVHSLQDAVKSSKLAYESTVQEQKVGSRTVLDVLNARNSYLSAQVDLVKTKISMVVCEFDLLGSYGTLKRDFVMNLSSYSSNLPDSVDDSSSVVGKALNELEGKNVKHRRKKRRHHSSSKHLKKKANRILERKASLVVKEGDYKAYDRDFSKANDYIIKHMQNTNKINLSQ